MTPLTITAHMGSPVVELGRWPLMLDGPLSWAAAQLGEWSGIAPRDVSDLDLPLGRWAEGEAWGWRISQATYDVAAEVSVQVRRKPDLVAFARFTTDKKFHPGLGPQKARDITMPATWARTLTWQADVTDKDRLRELLACITGIGKLAAHGYGQVLEWQIDGGAADGWRDRPLPSTHGPGRAYRPPYHHQNRQVKQ